MTKQNLGYSNMLNKSALIRQTFNDHPEYSNKEISSHILKIYGIDIQGNLIVNVVGPSKTRKKFKERASSINRLAQQLMISCGQDRRLAVLSLRGLNL